MFPYKVRFSKQDQMGLREHFFSPCFVPNGNIYLCCRPFGCGVILGGYDRDGPQLYMVEPSGVSYVS